MEFNDIAKLGGGPAIRLQQNSTSATIRGVGPSHLFARWPAKEISASSKKKGN